MAERLTDRTSLLQPPDDGDLMHIVDISDNTDNTLGTSKQLQLQFLREYLQITHVNEVPTGDFNGSNKDFQLSNTPISGSLLVFLNGQFLRPDLDYVLVGDIITLNSALSRGNLYAKYEI